MPRVSRPRCAGCNVVVENNRHVVNVLLKLYLSARTGKRIDSDCRICNGCRSKFIKWRKKVKDQVDELLSNKINEEEDITEVITSSRTLPFTAFLFSTGDS